ncbi:sigma-70 family RNA polymerase sigma factor [Sphingobacterium alkalisoli]|uniref:Sigma-70 family RNA polymerase sigma factor n=1 Tax=Sphingobacterium alkalisoli TaxID=1874115 RepID=A0A4U0H4X3_9SPHI|nr:sigma-70 family RNA polymerase sigma factor [Sphingobacterium alkalisoli]TJY66745.1 sigma-70 family RNA polymerase sigma factor [Sphingobacterium alkalisoli]GGH14469.1 DNA-directed RNA polymerase sigma-70 factor [Sphingobacterium alkalisoli]
MNQEWRELTQGNKDSFVRLYDAYYKPLFHYGLKIRQDRELIKDCLHMLFCELWEKRDSLPAEIQHPKFYLFTWLKRIILKNLPKEESGIESITEVLIEDSIEAQQIEIEQLIETHRKLETALAKLTRKQRRFIQLRFFENKSYEEISQLENASVRTVYNVIYESLKSLKGSFLYQLLLIFIFSK